MKQLIYISLLAGAFGCGPSHSGSNPPPTTSNRPITPAPKPTEPPKPNQRYHYQPAWLSAEWERDTWYVSEEDASGYGILPGQEPIADCMFRYWEAVRANWTTSLSGGVIPNEYLEKVPKTPDGILWVDNTNGKIQGFEKLKTTLSEMQTRCPSLLRPDLQAPLKVVWAKQDDIHAPGQFFPLWIGLRWDTDSSSVKLAANSNLRPSLYVRAEWMKENGSGWKWPLQTFKEQTGGKSYGDGGFTSFSIDETFAHEYGHFLLGAWALNHGRSNTQTQWFAEGFAELVRTVCWGGFQDRPSWIKSEMERELRDGIPFPSWPKTYRMANHRYSRQNEYMLDSIDNLLTWLAYKGEYNPDKVFQAILLTLERMQGEIVTDYPVTSPVDGVLTDTAPWTNWEHFKFPAVAADAPRLWTRSEFVGGICQALKDVGAESSCEDVIDVLKADQEGLKKDEW